LFFDEVTNLSLSLPLTIDIPFSFSAQIFFLPLLYDSTTSSLVFSYLFSFQRYTSTNKIVLVPTCLLLCQILLLLSPYLRFPILLPPSLLPSFSFFGFFFCFCYSGFPCFGFYCFPHSFEYLVIFISSVLQLTPEL